MQTTGKNNNGTSRDSSNRVDDTEDWDIDKFFLPGGILDPDTTSNNDDGGNGGQDDGNNHRQQHGLLDPIQEETLLTQMVQPSGVGVGSLLPTTTALLSASDNPWAEDSETNENEVVVGSSIVLGGGSSSSRSSSRIPSNNTTTAVATAATVTTTTSASLTLSSLCEDESPSLLLKGGNTIHEDGTNAALSSTDYSSSLFSVTVGGGAIHPPAQPRHDSGPLLSSPPLLFANRRQQQQRDNNGDSPITIMNNKSSIIAPPPGTKRIPPPPPPPPPPPGIIPLIPPPGFEAAASTTSLAVPMDPISTREKEEEEFRIERNDTQDSWYSTHSADDGSSGEGGEESDSIAAPVVGQPQHDAPQPSVLPSTVSLSPAKLDSANDDAAAAFPQQSLLQATPTRVPESWTTIETKESSDDRKEKNNDKIRSGSSNPYEHHRKKKVDDAAAVDDDNGSGRSESARRRKTLRDRDDNNNLSLPAAATISVSAQEEQPSSHLPVKSVKEEAANNKSRLKSKQQLSLKKQHNKRNRHVVDSLQNASKPDEASSNGDRNKVEEGPGMMAHAPRETQNNVPARSNRLQQPPSAIRSDDSMKRRFVSTLSNCALFLFHIVTTPFTHCFRFLSALYELITGPAAAAAAFVGKFGLICMIAVYRATMIALEESHLVHYANYVRDLLHGLFQPYNIIGPHLSFGNSSPLTSLCYLTLYFTPAVSDWIMQKADFPHYSPHIISNLTLYHLTYRMRQYVRRRTTDLPSPSRRGSARSNNSGAGSSGIGSGANLNNYFHSHNNNNVFAEADRRRLETDLNQKILRALLWAIPLNFICEGFSETDASFMRMDSFARLITAFGLSLVPGSFFLSPVAWVSGSVQILLSLYILQEGYVSDLVLIFVGITSVGLIRSLQTG